MRSNIPDIVTFTKRGVVVGNHFIISDLHIGYSDVIDSMTIEDERNEIIDSLQSVYRNHMIDKLVIAGDVFHEFGSPSRSARDLLRSIQEMTSNHRVEFVAIRGNHDKQALSNSRYLIDFKESYQFEVSTNEGSCSIGVAHGDKEPQFKSDLYIIGHLHPSVRIEGVSWPVYLYAQSIYEGSDLLVLPAFSSYKDGVIISKNTRTSIDFPMVSPPKFKQFYPIVYDFSDDSVKIFPQLAKSDKYFNV